MSYPRHLDMNTDTSYLVKTTEKVSQNRQVEHLTVDTSTRHKYSSLSKIGVRYSQPYTCDNSKDVPF